MTHTDVELHLQRVLERLPDAKFTGGNYVARCPAHNDNTPSLSVKLGENGSVVLFCFAGCVVQDVVAALNLELRDLFPDDGRQRSSVFTLPPPRRRIPRSEPKPTYTGTPMSRAEAERAAVRWVGKERGGDWTLGGSWVYDDWNGNPSLLVVRVDGTKDKVCPAFHAVGDKWAWKGPQPPTERPTDWLLPLHTDKLKAAPAGSYVFLVEGERKADELCKLGLLATTLPGGGSAQKNIDRCDLSVLRKHTVELLADHDLTGIKRAWRTAAKLVADQERELPVRVLPFARTFGGDYEKGADVADVIARLRADGLENDEIAERVCIRVENARGVQKRDRQ
jgi:hypothetical protein